MNYKPRISRERIAQFMALPIPKEGATHIQIAKALGITKQRVSQIEAMALRKLARNAKVLKILRELLESENERSAFY